MTTTLNIPPFIHMFSKRTQAHTPWKWSLYRKSHSIYLFVDHINCMEILSVYRGVDHFPPVADTPDSLWRKNILYTILYDPMTRLKAGPQCSSKVLPWGLTKTLAWCPVISWAELSTPGLQCLQVDSIFLMPRYRIIAPESNQYGTRWLACI